MATAAAATVDVYLRRSWSRPSRRLPRLFTCSFPSPSSSAAAPVTISISVSALALSSIPSRTMNSTRALSVADEAVDTSESEDDCAEERSRVRPCELYACNLPTSFDIADLSDLFKPYGTPLSVEITRDAETGASRGCGYVTMNSIPEAKAAVTALDGTDLGGREIHVKFSVDVASGRKNTALLNKVPTKDLLFESPHKIYVGNLAWSVRPEDLREHFSQVGTVVSARVLFDRKGGKNRVYGFLSFSSADELQAAIEKSGSIFRGRTLLVREVDNRAVINFTTDGTN